MIRLSLKESIGLIVYFRDQKGFYYEGELLGCDDNFLKYNDRKLGVRIISLDELKEVGLK